MTACCADKAFLSGGWKALLFEWNKWQSVHAEQLLRCKIDSEKLKKPPHEGKGGLWRASKHQLKEPVKVWLFQRWKKKKRAIKGVKVSQGTKWDELSKLASHFHWKSKLFFFLSCNLCRTFQHPSLRLEQTAKVVNAMRLILKLTSIVATFGKGFVALYGPSPYAELHVCDRTNVLNCASRRGMWTGKIQDRWGEEMSKEDWWERVCFTCVIKYLSLTHQSWGPLQSVLDRPGLSIAYGLLSVICYLATCIHTLVLTLRHVRCHNHFSTTLLRESRESAAV